MKRKSKWENKKRPQERWGDLQWNWQWLFGAKPSWGEENWEPVNFRKRQDGRRTGVREPAVGSYPGKYRRLHTVLCTEFEIGFEIRSGNWSALKARFQILGFKEWVPHPTCTHLLSFVPFIWLFLFFGATYMLFFPPPMENL